MRCALYVRKSTDEQAASIDVQIAEAERYVTSKGWTLAPGHIYRDDAVSRAEFKRRPGLIAMLNAAGAHAFDAVVIRDESRLGGDMHRTGLVLQDLIDHDVRVLYYFHDEEVRLDGATDKILQAVRGFAAELEREKIAERTREHLETKARRGLVVGGRVYGYSHVERRDGERRTHVEYAIHPEEAAVVREIFERYAKGDGLKRLVKDLNARGVPKPRTGARGTGSWATSSVHAMLRNERYRGVLTWGRREKAYRGGTKVRLATDAKRWIVASAPELRIVPDDMWFTVQARISDQRHGRKHNRGRPARYLLSGVLRCSSCGGPMTVTNHKIGTETVHVYTCGWHRDRGDSVCASTARRPVADVNAAVTEWVKANVLSEEIVLDVLKVVRIRLEERTASVASELPALEKRAAALRSEIARLVEALATTAEKPAPIVEAIAKRQDEASALEGRIRAAKAAPSAISLEVRRLEKEARQRVAALGKALERSPDEARNLMRVLFPDALKATPIETPSGRRFRIEGAAALGSILDTTDCCNSASPTGFEPVLQP